MWSWDLSKASDYAHWFPDGNGLVSAPNPSGAFTLAHEGEIVVSGILPAGVHTHQISTKHRGFLASPAIHLNDDYRVWFYVSGEGNPSFRYCVQHYPRDGTVYPIRDIKHREWQLEEYDLTYWNGDDVHFEIATAQDAPLRVQNVDRSWFGVREVIVRKQADPAPFRNPREFLEPLLERAREHPPHNVNDLAQLYQQTVRDAVLDRATNDAAMPKRFSWTNGCGPGYCLTGSPALRTLSAERRQVSRTRGGRPAADARPWGRRVDREESTSF